MRDCYPPPVEGTCATETPPPALADTGLDLGAGVLLFSFFILAALFAAALSFILFADEEKG